MALYDENYKPHIVGGVVLSDTEEKTKVDVPFKGPVKGILLNHGDHGYAKVHFDKKSLDNFEQNLYKIEDSLSRSMIWQ